MTAETKIEWADSTFNPWSGCTKISPACDHCYAEALSKRAPTIGKWGAGAPRRRTSPAYWKQPLRWNARRFVQCECGWRGQESEFPDACCQQGHSWTEARRRVFCASLADVFDNEIDLNWRADLFELIAATPNLDWLLLTKRIGLAAPMISFTRGVIAGRECIGERYMQKERGQPEWPQWPLPNVWLGATICNQAEADRDIPKLLATPAAKRFLSIEPMLGPIDLERPMPGPDLDQGGGGMICQPWYIQSGLDWVICGGESGPHARPMHPDWARSLRDQCAAAGVPFLFKQWGEWAPQIGAVDGWAMDDDPEISKFDHLEWEDGQWGDVFRPQWCDFQDGNYDEEHTVSRIGKKRAGRLLDGVEHNGVPA